MYLETFIMHLIKLFVASSRAPRSEPRRTIVRPLGPRISDVGPCCAGDRSVGHVRRDVQILRSDRPRDVREFLVRVLRRAPRVVRSDRAQRVPGPRAERRHERIAAPLRPRYSLLDGWRGLLAKWRECLAIADQDLGRGG